MTNYETVWNDFVDGDNAAFVALYEAFYPALFRYGIKYVSDTDLIKDTIHEMFLELADQRHKLGHVKQVNAYLHQCYRHKLFRYAKGKAGLDQLAEGYFEHSQRPYEDYLIQLQSEEKIKRLLTKALRKLTPRQKMLLQLRFYEDMSIEEISRQTNLTKRTVYNKIHEGLKILRVSLQGEHELFSDSIMLYLMLLKKK